MSEDTKRAGVVERRKKGFYREVLGANQAHPDWTIGQIAKHLGCLPEYVSVTFRRYGGHGRPAPRRHLQIRQEATEAMREACLEAAPLEERSADHTTWVTAIAAYKAAIRDLKVPNE